MQDSHGRRETTVTLRRGSQAFVSTTTEDGQGKEHREELLGVDDREWGAGGGTGGVRGRGQRPVSEPPLPSRGAGAVRRHVAAARRAPCAHPERPLGRAGQLLPSLVLRLVALTSCWPPPVRERGVGGTGGAFWLCLGWVQPLLTTHFPRRWARSCGDAVAALGAAPAPPPSGAPPRFGDKHVDVYRVINLFMLTVACEAPSGTGPPQIWRWGSHGSSGGCPVGVDSPEPAFPLLPGNRQHWECWEAPTGHWGTAGGDWEACRGLQRAPGSPARSSWCARALRGLQQGPRMLEGSTGRALWHPGGHWRSLGGFRVVLVDTRGLWSGLSIHRRAVVLPGRTPGHPRGHRGAFRWLQLVLE